VQVRLVRSARSAIRPNQGRSARRRRRNGPAAAAAGPPRTARADVPHTGTVRSARTVQCGFPARAWPVPGRVCFARFSSIARRSTS